MTDIRLTLSFVGGAGFGRLGARIHRPTVACAARKLGAPGSHGSSTSASSQGMYGSCERIRIVGRRPGCARATVLIAFQTGAGILSEIVLPIPFASSERPPAADVTLIVSMTSCRRKLSGRPIIEVAGGIFANEA